MLSLQNVWIHAECHLTYCIIITPWVELNETLTWSVVCPMFVFLVTAEDFTYRPFSYNCFPQTVVFYLHPGYA